jgi:uncharacterized membrane protein HdeD (DUF308 family)
MQEEAVMSMKPSDAERIEAAMASTLGDHWKLFLIEGVVLLVLGVLAIAVPQVATLAVEILIGWLFLVSGIVGAIMTFSMRTAPGFWWSLLSAILGIGAGIALLVSPATGAVSLTLILIAFFIIEGVASIMFALEHKRELSGRWGWMLASGIVDLVLAGAVFVMLPGAAGWVIGLMVGINLVFGGSALIAMALHARDATATATAS